ncbi:MAG TPA: phosphotransferase [Actinomycetota bacterium]|nr:phosphotransferase [Actinomycetota bacterium]
MVIKHVHLDGLVASLGGQPDRQYRLWTDGVFDRVPSVIDHAILAVEPDDDGWILVLRDVSNTLLPDDYVLTRDESRRVLSAVNELHQEFWGEYVEQIPSLDEYYSVFLRLHTVAADFSISKLIARGWELFPDVAPPDIAGAMAALLGDPALISTELTQHPTTFIHGDLRLHNLGLTADKVVLLDWEITANAPPFVEFAWYLIISATRVDASREQIIDDFREISGEHFDPRALEIALIGGLASLGWNKALDIVENPDPAVRERERADLDWWIARVRTALETWSPV